MDPQTKSVNLQRKSYEGIAIFIAIFSLLAAIVGVIFQFRAEKKRELTCNVTSNNELTAVSSVPELTARFTYKNKEVAHLWKLSLNCVNTGNDTLIGQGPHNTLMGDGLSFEFPKDMEILNFELTNTDVSDINFEQPKRQAEEISTGQNQTAAETDGTQPNKFRLKFAQWRRSERVNFSMYIASSNKKTPPLLPAVTTRDIVDGDVVIKHSLIPPDQAKRTLVDRLPLVASVTVKFFISIVCGFLVWFGFYFIPKSTTQFIRLSLWKRKNLRAFTEYVEKADDIEDSLKQIYIENPEMFPEEKWDSYPGKKLKVSQVEFSSLSRLMIIGVAGLLLGVAGGIYILSNAIDLYRAVFSRFA